MKKQTNWRDYIVKLILFAFYLIIFWVSLYVLTCCYKFESLSSVWFLLIILVPLVLLSFPFAENLLSRVSKLKVAGIEIALKDVETNIKESLDLNIEFDSRGQEIEKSTLDNFERFIKRLPNDNRQNIVFKLDMAEFDSYLFAMIYFQLKVLEYFFKNPTTILLIDSVKDSIDTRIKGSLSIKNAIQNIEKEFTVLPALFFGTKNPRNSSQVDQYPFKSGNLNRWWHRFHDKIEDSIDNSKLHRINILFEQLFLVDAQKFIVKLPIDKQDYQHLYKILSEAETVIFIVEGAPVVKTSGQLGITLSKSFLFNAGKMKTDETMKRLF